MTWLSKNRGVPSGPSGPLSVPLTTQLAGAEDDPSPKTVFTTVATLSGTVWDAGVTAMPAPAILTSPTTHGAGACWAG